ncbi:hypothetical protein VTK26DRAFT_9310 [Humicola hyalothermophila]
MLNLRDGSWKTSESYSGNFAIVLPEHTSARDSNGRKSKSSCLQPGRTEVESSKGTNVGQQPGDLLPGTYGGEPVPEPPYRAFLWFARFGVRVSAPAHLSSATPTITTFPEIQLGLQLCSNYSR